jgi:Ca2+-binding EF-hand superfamily protein
MDATGLGHSGSMKVDVDASAPSAKTLQQVPTRRRRVQERLAALDTDQDGVVSKEELVRSC